MTHSALNQLKNLTTVVADTGDLEAIRQFRPLDATTNPSLITAAAAQPENRTLIQSAFEQAKQENFTEDALIERTIDILTVKLGVEILKLVEGRVSTEVDASLSFRTEATVKKAHELIELYQQYGIDKKRVLIKIASTWEGIQAARILEAEGIHCNLTLLFGLHQAQACADAKVTLISPFVGRILDWYKKSEGVESYPTERDPGVQSVKKIYYYYKQQGIQTQVMGASFRSIDQVLGLAGCDLLTIAPSLLSQLEEDEREIQTALSIEQAKQAELIECPAQTPESFASELDKDLMAYQLLLGGIDGFISARHQLSIQLRQMFGMDAEIKP